MGGTQWPGYRLGGAQDGNVFTPGHVFVYDSSSMYNLGDGTINIDSFVIHEAEFIIAGVSCDVHIVVAEE